MIEEAIKLIEDELGVKVTSHKPSEYGELLYITGDGFVDEPITISEYCKDAEDALKSAKRILAFRKSRLNALAKVEGKSFLELTDTLPEDKKERLIYTRIPKMADSCFPDIDEWSFDEVRHASTDYVEAKRSETEDRINHVVGEYGYSERDVEIYLNGIARWYLDMAMNTYQESKKVDAKKVLKESYFNGPTYVYTGLSYKEEYANIISSVVGQIYDGIGESDSKEGRIFQYYFKPLDYIHSGCSEKGEFYVDIEKFDLDLLINCIWRIAKIERQDNGQSESNKNGYYDYLDADWRSICTLQAALKKIRSYYIDGSNDPEKDRANGVKVPGDQWTDEEAAAMKEKRAAAKAKAEAEQRAKEAKAAEERAAKEAERKSKIDTFVSANTPDEKDISRAESVDARSGGDINKYWNYANAQLNTIKDDAKYRRRLVALYTKAKEKFGDTGFAKVWLEQEIEKLAESKVVKAFKLKEGIGSDYLVAVAEALLDCGVCDSIEDAEDLTADISSDVLNKDIGSTAKGISDYLIQVYGEDPEEFSTANCEDYAIQVIDMVYSE